MNVSRRPPCRTRSRACLSEGAAHRPSEQRTASRLTYRVWRAGCGENDEAAETERTNVLVLWHREDVKTFNIITMIEHQLEFVGVRRSLLASEINPPPKVAQRGTFTVGAGCDLEFEAHRDRHGAFPQSSYFLPGFGVVTSTSSATRSRSYWGSSLTIFESGSASPVASTASTQRLSSAKVVSELSSRVRVIMRLLCQRGVTR